MDGAADGCAQTGVKAKLSESAHAKLRVHPLKRSRVDVDLCANKDAFKDAVNFEYCLTIRL
jgi:hypothetical protein